MTNISTSAEHKLNPEEQISEEDTHVPNEDDTDHFNALPLPPDGGWGWIVTVASFFCNFIVDGVCYSFGIFQEELLDYFKEGTAKTALVGSLLSGTYLAVGPLVSALANKFGCRIVTIGGSILAAISFIISTFSPNINVLIFTYGIMGGFGFGLMYLPAIVIVGFYFEKKRAFATGIAVCGSGVGTFVFAPLTRILINRYGWKGGLWIISGITLNGIASGALFRPLTSHSRKTVKKTDLTKEEVDQKVRGEIMKRIIAKKKKVPTATLR